MALDRNSVLKPVKKLRKLIRNLDKPAVREAVHGLGTITRRFEAALESFTLDARGVDKSFL